MTKWTETTWHRESYDRFLQERLPELLSERLPLAGYSSEFTSETTARVTVTVNGPTGEVSTTFDNLPRPDADGLLWLGMSNSERDYGPLWRHGRVVLPYADNEDLTVANIACIGERLLGYIDERIGQSTEGLPWDEALLRSWAPIDTWAADFFTANSQWLDKTNWLAVRVHIRRLVIPGASGDLIYGNAGLVSPLETPDGPNVNKILSIAAGATIKDGKLIVVDDSPEAGFGLPALMIPFIEHGSDARLIMSCNMQRQWLPTLQPEPALVQTGWEPDAPGFWCGRSLLTAYVPWGESTFEDAVVISESAAKRFPTEVAPTQSYRDAYHPVQAGDFLSNRHGAKCTIGRILPDAEMPHLGGVPVDIVYSPSGVVSRLNLGQLWEAAASRIAYATGEPVIASPFHGPTQSELRTRFAELGLPEDGLAQLTDGKGGAKLERSSCVGWVYWGRLDHEPADKVFYTTGSQTVDSSDGNVSLTQRYLEYAALRDIGAFETIREHYGTRAARNPHASTLAERLVLGPVEQSDAPSPAFVDLGLRLAAVGVKASLDSDGRLVFATAAPKDGLTLVRPVAHPWLRDNAVASVGRIEEVEGYAEIARINTQIERLVRSGAPEKLIKKGLVELESAVATYFEALVEPSVLRWNETVIFSGRAVLSPGSDLAIDEMSLPEDIAWGLFEPMLPREFGDAAAIARRTPAAVGALDALMARSWVLLYTVNLYAEPAYCVTPLLAVRPRRGDGSVIRVHNRVTSLMNVDFDGDRIAVFLPVTDAGQKEAGELLTPRAYLNRDPGLIDLIRPSMDGMWGLARLSLDEAGREELADMGLHALPAGLLTKGAVTSALTRIAERDGIDAAIDVADRLRVRGFEVAKASGWSIGPFLGHSLSLPPRPAPQPPIMGGQESYPSPALASTEGVRETPIIGAEGPESTLDWFEEWPRYVEEVTDILTRKTTFEDNDLDPLRLSILSGARGTIRQLLFYLIGPGRRDANAGHSLVEGLTPAESTQLAFSLRRGWYQNIKREMSLDSPRTSFAAFGPITSVAAPNVAGHHVLARAMRAAYPGAVFARAAATGEVDPLTTLDSRLFVGLMPR